MKVAVVGGGTAGFLSAATLTKLFPQFELHHIWDSRIPAIGVGEGTELGFQVWIDRVLGVPPQVLHDRCFMTRKFGNRFEGWGKARPFYFHHFYPIRERHAYHLSAEVLVELLHDHVDAVHQDRRVDDLVSDGRRVGIVFEDGGDLEVDLCLDARGFPKELTDEHLPFDAIASNAAIVRQTDQLRLEILDNADGQSNSVRSATRAVARPHGWIFVIPLLHRTSYGYVHNADVSDPQSVTSDFDEFMAEEGIEPKDEGRFLRFPTFVRRRVFDGALMHVGNTASFLEPLEATAIGTMVKQVLTLSYWPLRKWAEAGGRTPLLPVDIATFNRHLFEYVKKLGWFVAWHYAEGSRWETPFWDDAQRRYLEMTENPDFADVRGDFEVFRARAADLPHPFEESGRFDAETRTGNFLKTGYGQFPAPSFAEVGHGIGDPSLHQGSSS